eukprot:TRINITY_DN29536_c0_g1_i1.p1 TRINITY_DN29536_c0_g1~~TRINITY_DN29536_c0_g1_i1.p1  ORF type:complete len:226 (+),score=69.82 TRINITY_DN29536_c0_g1_i1:28-678(+)
MAPSSPCWGRAALIAWLPILASCTDEAVTPSAMVQDRGKALLVCRLAIWRKWSSGMEEVSALVQSTMEASTAEGSQAVSYEKAARLLAERQLAACSKEVTAADLQAHQASGLGDAAVERLLGGAAISGPLLTEEDHVLFEKALKGETTDAEAPSIMGVQVHEVPLALQVLYMTTIVAVVCYVVMLVVRQLTARDKAQAEKIERSKREKEAREAKKR